jgi:hypothetical protein
MRKVLTALLLMVLVACTQGPAYRTQALPSGKSVKVLGMTKMFFRQGDPALILKYQTDLPIDDVPGLAKEADEIWPLFRINVEKAGLSSGAITATTPPEGHIVKRSKTYTFVYTKATDGQWSRKRK